jgi:hypothetical protein
MTSRARRCHLQDERHRGGRLPGWRGRGLGGSPARPEDRPAWPGVGTSHRTTKRIAYSYSNILLTFERVSDTVDGMDIKVFLPQVTLVAALLFGKERPSARAAEIAARPGWVRPQWRAMPTVTAEARPAGQAREDGPAGYGCSLQAHPAGPRAALADRPVQPRRGRGFRRRRLRRLDRRLRHLRPGPQQSLHRVRRRPGRSPG